MLRPKKNSIKINKNFKFNYLTITFKIVKYQSKIRRVEQ